MSYTSPFTGDVIIPTDVSYRFENVFSEIYLVWPTFATNENQVVARIMDVETDFPRTLFMPPANQVSVGQDVLFRNIGTYPVYIRNNANNPICTVDGGQSQYIYVTDNTTEGGEWGVIAFGSTTSSANASELAGYGLTALFSTLNQSHPTSTFSNGDIFYSDERAKTKIWTSGSGTVTLSDAAGLGDNWFVLLKNNGTGTITVNCSLSNTIDGNLTKNFAPDESAFIICTGTEFVTVGYGQSSDFVFNALVKPVVSGTYILTPSEARNTIQEYVGNLSGDVLAQYPPAVNLYVISNQTVDNGYSLTITTGISGGANAIVPPGNQVTLICDGTNFLNANTIQAGSTIISLVDGTVTTPALNFGTETNTGIYHDAFGEMNISVLGVEKAKFVAGGLEVTGSVLADGVGNFAGGIEGGVFS